MNEIFSRIISTPNIYRRIREIIERRHPLNRQRVLSISDGRKMPDNKNLAIGSAKRMNASVLFFDIEKFTINTSQLPPEYTLYILNLIIPTVMRIVKIFGADVEKNTGDGIMAIFPANTRDKPAIAQVAVESALIIKHFMLNDIQQHLYKNDLPLLNFRIGIDLDELLIAKIGYESNNFLTAVGNAANRASKLQTLADTNGICIGESVVHNLHSELIQYCVEGLDTSWDHYMRGSNIAYRYFHFNFELSEPTRL